MIDLCLRTDTEAEMIAALPFARTVDEAGSDIWIDATRDYALCVIGPVVTTPGVYDDDGEELTPPVIDSRFHANLRCTEVIAAKVPNDVRITVETPLYGWYGDADG